MVSIDLLGKEVYVITDYDVCQGRITNVSFNNDVMSNIEVQLNVTDEVVKLDPMKDFYFTRHSEAVRHAEELLKNERRRLQLKSRSYREERKRVSLKWNEALKSLTSLFGPISFKKVP